MRLFPPTLEIGEEEGFSVEKDIFKRSATGKGLTNVVRRVSDPLVIAVDSEWGTGKTTFLKMWAGELRKERIPTIFFDAYQNDYADDAFTAIAGEVISLAAERRRLNDSAVKKLLESSKDTAKILLRSGLKIGTKLATAGALEAADFGEAVKEISKEASDLEDKYIGELLTKKKQEKQAIQSFREALESLPGLLGQPDIENEGEQNNAPLVIIVDELVRCRPTFSLQVLERIKHFFSVPGVHFVLGTHLGQLRNSVSAVYGPGIDSTKYLQKFISLTLHLTDSQTKHYRRTSTVYIDHLMSAMLPEPEFARIVELAKSYFGHLAYKSDLSLRSIEKIISTLATALAFRPENVFCPYPLLIGLCALKVVNPDAYARAKSGTPIHERARDSLAFNETPEEAMKHSVEHLIKVWRYFADQSIADDNPQYRGFGDEIFRFNLDRWDAIPFVARNVIDRFSEKLD